MAKLKNTDYIMYFDLNRYEAEMKKALMKATRKVRQLLYDTIIRNIEALPFKDNPVHLANGRVTSDAERKKALIDSISKEGHARIVEDFVSFYDKVVMEASVSAMTTNFEDSHVGWYYEIGTGEESDPEGYAKYGMSASLGDPNPYRLPHVGAPIVSRSAHDGYWRDLGGNLRKTSSQIGGIGNPEPPESMDPVKYHELVERFRSYIGEDIKAYYWFERAVEEVSDKVLDIYKEAVMSVDIFDPKLGIFHLNKKITISDKYTVG